MPKARNTVRSMHEQLVAKVALAIDLDVEFIHFMRDPKAKTVTCVMTFKNGFRVEGCAILLPGLPATCEDTARRAALVKVVMIHQYKLAEKIYHEALASKREILK